MRQVSNLVLIKQAASGRLWRAIRGVAARAKPRFQNGYAHSTFWNYLRNAYGRNAGLRLDHVLLNSKLVPRLKVADVDKHVRGWAKRAIMRQAGWNW